MTFEQLEYFIAAATQNTFLDAAEKVNISQSSLSKQIAKLEKELDVKLFERSKRSASLTDAGKIFFDDANLLLRQHSEALGRLTHYRNTTEYTLRIGTLPILTQYQLTPVFKNFLTIHPEIQLSLEEVEEVDLMNGLNDSRYDLIIARENMLDSNHHKLYPLTDDQLVAVLPYNHCLASSPSISLTDLAHEKFILMNSYTAVYKLCIEEFKKAGLTLNLLRTARVESIISAVAIGEGISLLAYGNFKVFTHEHITAVPLTPAIKLPIVAARKKGVKSSKALMYLIEQLSTTVCNSDT